jgi:hypothetical protein
MWSRGRHWPTEDPDDVRTVACHDELGRRARMTVVLHGDRVLIGEQWWLSPLQAGQLRAAIRDVVTDLDSR